MSEPYLVDVHTHLNFPDFAANQRETITRALAQNIWLINVGTDLASSRAVVALTEEYSSGVYAIIGVHPAGEEKFLLEPFSLLAQEPKVVGIGECGFDFFHTDGSGQAADFEAQVALARGISKPLMLHLRNSQTGQSAYAAALAILAGSGVKGNVHFFAGTKSEAKAFLDLGFTLSFTGVITFTDAYDELIKYIPLDRLLLETDSPYVAPVPHRGHRNESSYVDLIAKAVAEKKGVPVAEVARVTTITARSLFGF